MWGLLDRDLPLPRSSLRCNFPPDTSQNTTQGGAETAALAAQMLVCIHVRITGKATCMHQQVQAGSYNITSRYVHRNLVDLSVLHWHVPQREIQFFSCLFR